MLLPFSVKLLPCGETDTHCWSWALIWLEPLPRNTSAICKIFTLCYNLVCVSQWSTIKNLPLVEKTLHHPGLTSRGKGMHIYFPIMPPTLPSYSSNQSWVKHICKTLCIHSDVSEVENKQDFPSYNYSEWLRVWTVTKARLKGFLAKTNNTVNVVLLARFAL